MGRSQRHMVIRSGSAANGEIFAEGRLAPGIVQQVADSVPPTTRAELGESLSFKSVTVPVGPPGGPLAGSSLTGPVPEDFVPPEPPEPEEDYRIIGINPGSIPAGYPDMTAEVNGLGFEDGAVIVFGGTDMATDFLSDNQLRFIVPSGDAVEGTVQVQVRNPGGGLTAEHPFNFTAAAVQLAGERTFPIGPFSIRAIDDHEDGIAIMLFTPEGFEEGNIDIAEGDVVRVEATGNTSINGDYEVLTVDGTTVIVDNNYVLAAPIDNKGRVTVIEGA